MGSDLYSDSTPPQVLSVCQTRASWSGRADPVCSRTRGTNCRVRLAVGYPSRVVLYRCHTVARCRESLKLVVSRICTVVHDSTHLIWEKKENGSWFASSVSRFRLPSARSDTANPNDNPWSCVKGFSPGTRLRNRAALSFSISTDWDF